MYYSIDRTTDFINLCDKSHKADFYYDKMKEFGIGVKDKKIRIYDKMQPIVSDSTKEDKQFQQIINACEQCCLDSSGKFRLCRKHEALMFVELGKLHPAKLHLKHSDGTIYPFITCTHEFYRKRCGFCRLCGRFSKLHLGHKIPRDVYRTISGGQGYSINNIILTCSDCEDRISNKQIDIDKRIDKNCYWIDGYKFYFGMVPVPIKKYKEVKLIDSSTRDKFILINVTVEYLRSLKYIKSYNKIITSYSRELLPTIYTFDSEYKK